MFTRVFIAAVLALALPTGIFAADDPDATLGVKAYLVDVATRMHGAAKEFEKNAHEYQQLIDGAGGDYRLAWKNSAPQLRALVEKMRENYKAMDSFGYENVEGIVAGVHRFADFDVYLDAGVPQSDAGSSSPVAPVVLKTSTGRSIEHEGCLFTYIIEPALWGGNAHYVIALDLDGDGKIAAHESLPQADVLAAAAVDVRKKIGELLAAAGKWQPTTEDCFAAIITMTPTLSGYFEDWKASRYAPENSGKFSAVSRVSDMRGIMSSVALLYRAVDPAVEKKDGALAKSIGHGFADILSFIDRVEAREKKVRITDVEIEELTARAKARADKLVPQVEQAAALLDLQGA